MQKQNEQLKSYYELKLKYIDYNSKFKGRNSFSKTDNDMHKCCIPILGFKPLDLAERTIAEIEIMHMTHKVQIKGIRCVQS